MPRIVVVGSSNVDMVVSAPRIPVPGETILGGSFMTAAGGKGANQAVAAARLGGEVRFVARVGADVFGDQAIAGYAAEGMDTEHVHRDEEAPTGIAMIMVDDGGENAISVASGANMRLRPEDVEPALEDITRHDVVLLQLEVPFETVCHAASRASDIGALVVLNPAPGRPLPQELFERIDVLTPNETEAEILTGTPVDDGPSAGRAAMQLRADGVGTVIVTLGSAGVWLAGGKAGGPFPAEAVRAVDTTAAGDAFNGALAVALAERRPMEEAIRFATRCAAISVTRRGAQPSLPVREEVED